MNFSRLRSCWLAAPALLACSVAVGAGASAEPVRAAESVPAADLAAMPAAGRNPELALTWDAELGPARLWLGVSSRRVPGRTPPALDDSVDPAARLQPLEDRDIERRDTLSATARWEHVSASATLSNSIRSERSVGANERHATVSEARAMDGELRHLGPAFGPHRLLLGATFGHDFRPQRWAAGAPADPAQPEAASHWAVFADDEWRAGSTLQVSLGLRHQRARDGRRTTRPRLAAHWAPAPEFSLSFQHDGTGDPAAAESAAAGTPPARPNGLSARWLLPSGLGLDASCGDAESPFSRAALRLTSPGPWAGAGVAMTALQVGERLTPGGTRLAPYLRMDARLTHSSPASPWRLSVGLDNLTGERNAEPGSAAAATAAGQGGMSWRAQLARPL